MSTIETGLDGEEFLPVMRNTTQDAQRGIRWTLFSSLDDLDFVDDLALTTWHCYHIHINTFKRKPIDCVCLDAKLEQRFSQQKTETMLLNA
ncbi:hypothetical protein DPMN_130200 [Dreissena polymorpha]|uniref:Uncharacterized protein n=1 Tax=Dreissena polymorpha TaxID=45954 RepID=A0A9D4K163_DREPO|nr:hypothetical protein DPMN_130200 [Dreissena polymorpha]